MRDIAETAGVHYSTVSLSLKNHPRIPKETRERVQRVAKEMGYSPEPILTRLAAYRQATKPVSFHSTLGIITTSNWPANHHTAMMAHAGITERAGSLGYSTEVFRLAQSGTSRERLRRTLRARNIDGIIVAPLKQQRGHLNFDWSPFCTATLGLSLVRPRLHRVAHNHYRSTRQLIRNLFRLGYRNIGFTFQSIYDTRLDNSWSAAMSVEGARSRGKIQFFDPTDTKKEDLARWLKSARPDVVVGIHHGVLDAIRSLGYAVPEEIGFAHLTLPTSDGSMAGIIENSKQIGSAVIDILVGMLQRDERGVPQYPYTVHFEGEWIDGVTLKGSVNERKKVKTPEQGD